MTVSVAFAVIGGVILIGFAANLLFRATRIPNVLLLIAIGVILGPVTGWVASSSLIDIAPFFGTLALLMILFEGGLDLDIRSVVREAPKAALLSILIYFFSLASVFLFAFFILRMPLFHAVLTAAVFSASSPAICLPIISGLSIKNATKTILKLESTLGDVLLIVTVLLVLDFQATGSQTAMGMLYKFIASFAAAFFVASIAGVVWSRLIGWMGKEPLSYMLTLGVVFLLYFSVEELGGSAAIAVLLFGLLLENMHIIAGRIGERARYLFGIDIRAEQFVLHEFMKNITEELSFLIRTFFFVYLGLILNFKSITPGIAISGAGIVLLLFGSRWLSVHLIRKKCNFTGGELQIVLAMLPRGLATAVMAFLPVQQGVAGTELLPVYAFTVIVLTNVLMTGGVIWAERRLAQEKDSGTIPESLPASPEREIPECYAAATIPPVAEVVMEDKALAGESPDQEKEEAPYSLRHILPRIIGIRPEDRQWRCIQIIQAASMVQPQFWMMIFFAAILTILGMVMNQSAIILGAALIVPIAWPLIAAGFALAIGDMYLFLKLLLKLFLAAVMIVLLAIAFNRLLPFNAFTEEIASRTGATILDFLVAFFAGMAGAAVLFSRRKMLQFLPGVVLAITLAPPLAVMGLGIGNSLNWAVFRGGAVLFTANFFAAILGSSLVYAIAGIPAAAELNVIRDWKQRELNRPFVNLIFERLRLKELAGRTGSVRSRLVVALVFLLALVIPLQMAFNQLSLEFRARQAVAEVKRMFEVPGRSAIVNTSSTINADTITVKLQVATNAFFEAADIRRFEERVADRTGTATHLDLVQSLSDMGEGEAIRKMFRMQQPFAGQGDNISAATDSLRSAIENKLQSAFWPPSMVFLRIGVELGLDRQPSSFRIDYLSDLPLSEDAEKLLVNMLELVMQLRPGSIRLACVQARYAISFNGKGRIEEKESAQLQKIQNALASYAQLNAAIALPDSLEQAPADRMRRALSAAAPLLADPLRTTVGLVKNENHHGIIISLFCK